MSDEHCQWSDSGPIKVSYCQITIISIPSDPLKESTEKEKKVGPHINFRFHSIGHTLTFNGDICVISECAFICPLMTHDDYIDASTNSPLYLMNQGGCPGYKSGSAAPSPSQGGGMWPLCLLFLLKVKNIANPILVYPPRRQELQCLWSFATF